MTGAADRSSGRPLQAQRGATIGPVHDARAQAVSRRNVQGAAMTERSLQVTYRKGRVFAAYLHLSHHTGEKSTRTVASADGRLIVDYGAEGRAIGVEITAALAVSLERLNELLVELGETPLSETAYLPLRAA